jgi:DNA invertase Pin-like site-specific DNA recombinase
MARAAIYGRYSSDLQNPRSIEDQVALCRRWCEREGHGVVEIFSDAALSGASVHGRVGLKNLIAGAVDRRFDVVVVESFDRVARSQSELPQVWEMLRFCGCELVAVDDGRASEISIGVRGLVGALYLTDLASKTRRGLAGKLAQGQRAGGLPFGYRPIAGRPGEHEIDRDQAAVVLRIFQDYARGHTCRDIAAALNREGVKPYRGRAWNASTIHGSAKRASGMICNEIYRGVIVWNRVTIRRRVARCRESIRAVSGGGPRRRICASCQRSFGRRRQSGSPKHEPRIPAGRAYRLAASYRVSCGVVSVAQASSRPARNAAGPWHAAPARSSREIAPISASVGLI